MRFYHVETLIQKKNSDPPPFPATATLSSHRGRVDQVLKTFGRIDVLVNNAGIIRRRTIETVTEEDWDRIIAIDLKGTFNCCKAVSGSPRMWPRPFFSSPPAYDGDSDVECRC